MLIGQRLWAVGGRGSSDECLTICRSENGSVLWPWPETHWPLIQEGFYLQVICMHSVIHAQTPKAPVWSRTVPPCAASWRLPIEIDPCSIKVSVMGCRPRLGTWPSPSGLSTTQPGEGEPCRQPIAFLEEGTLAPGQPDWHRCSKHERYHWVMLLTWNLDTQLYSKTLIAATSTRFFALFFYWIKLSCFRKQNFDVLC